MPRSVFKVDQQTLLTRGRYDRLAPVYDAMEWFVERAAIAEWRRRLWARVPVGRILEVGVGTGKNIPYYPPNAAVTAIDVSDGMLRRARRRAGSLGHAVDIRRMDVQQVDLPDDMFDAVVSTFVFCSVPDPVAGLREVGRVVRRDGNIWLLEHVRIDRPVVGRLMDVLNPFVVRIMGANINRRTVENVMQAGLQVVSVESVKGNLVKCIHARRT